MLWIYIAWPQDCISGAGITVTRLVTLKDQGDEEEQYYASSTAFQLQHDVTSLGKVVGNCL